MLLSKKFLKDTIDYIVLSLLGLLFLGYSIFYKSFAELHIQLPFFDFPIFTGEIILAFCIVLTLYKWFLSRKKFNRIYIAFLIYIIFVLWKAFAGYGKFGPLAFRHAAMFYYPLFALIAYEAYQSKFKNPHIFLPLFFILNSLGIAAYYRFTYVILMFIYVLLVRNKILKVLGLLIIALSHSDGMSIFIKLFSHCPRTQIIGNIAAFMFLFMTILLILRIKKIYKISLVVLFLFILGVGLIKLANYRSGYKFLINPKNILTSINEWEEIIEIKRRNYQKQEIPIKLYNQEEKQKMSKPSQASNKPEEEKETSNDDVSIMKVILPPEDREVKRIVDYIENKGGTVEFPESQQLVKDLPISHPAEQPKPKAISKGSEANANQEKGASQKAQKAIDALQEITQYTPKELIISFDIEQSPEQKKEIIALLPKDDNLKKQIIYHVTDLAIQKNEYTQGLNRHLSTGAYRLLTWRDMIKELIKEKAAIGFYFGKPLRSESIEISKMAYGEWTRDGWIAAHNSYMEFIYRSGIIGIILILCFFITLFRIIRSLINSKSLIGILLFSIIIYWLTVAFVYVTFEMPYSAIFFWSLFGFILAYSKQLQNNITNK